MHHFHVHLKAGERGGPGKSQQQAGCPWRPRYLVVPGWAEGLPTYETTEQWLWEMGLVPGDKWAMGNCFRPGSNLEADFWELVNTQLLIPRSGISKHL